MIAQKQYEDSSYKGYYNVGPCDEDCVTTETLVNLFCEDWGEGQKWVSQCVDGPFESNYLKLDCSKIRKVFNWRPTWQIEKAVEKTVEFYKSDDIKKCIVKQIEEFDNERGSF